MSLIYDKTEILAKSHIINNDTKLEEIKYGDITVWKKQIYSSGTAQTLSGRTQIAYTNGWHTYPEFAYGWTNSGNAVTISGGTIKFLCKCIVNFYMYIGAYEVDGHWTGSWIELRKNGTNIYTIDSTTRFNSAKNVFGGKNNISVNAGDTLCVYVWGGISGSSTIRTNFDCRNPGSGMKLTYTYTVV